MQEFHFANLISKIAFFSSEKLKKGSDIIMATKNTKKNLENESEKTQKSVSENVKNEVSKSQKIRSYRDLKLKALRREKMEDWELEKIADRIVFLKDEKEKLKQQKKAITEELQELKIILKTYKK